MIRITTQDDSPIVMSPDDDITMGQAYSPELLHQMIDEMIGTNGKPSQSNYIDIYS